MVSSYELVPSLVETGNQPIEGFVDLGLDRVDFRHRYVCCHFSVIVCYNKKEIVSRMAERMCFVSYSRASGAIILINKFLCFTLGSHIPFDISLILAELSL